MRNDPYTTILNSSSYEDFVKTTYESLVDKRIGHVYSNKKYLGHRTGHNHQIDVSIEVELAYLSIIILIECKYYKDKVQISDLLEFAQRIDDIGAHKGVLVSTEGFQQGALKVAKAHRIALVTTAPVWQSIMPHVNSRGECDAFTLGGLYVGQGSSHDRFLGVTVQLLNGVMEQRYTFVEAWLEIVDFLRVDARCAICKTFLFDPADGPCASCISNLTLKCTSCNEALTLMQGACSRCFKQLTSSDFAESTWYKCGCGKMMCISDLDKYSATCKCGITYNYKDIEKIRRDTIGDGIESYKAF